jgi:hypothetical protein
MNEAEIKTALIGWLLANCYQPGMLLINEFTNMRCGARADIAMLSEGNLVAFEIKSPRDTTRRLRTQVDMYDKYFDKYVVVTTGDHINDVICITNGSRCGIWLYSGNGFQVVRKGRSKKVSDSIILDRLLPASSKEGSGSPRRKLFNSIFYRYKNNIAEMCELIDNDGRVVGDVKRLNPNFIRRNAARETLQRYHDIWASLCSMSDQSTQSSSMLIAERS